MGTAQLQGDLWAERAYYWATLLERTLLPAFETVLMKLAIDNNTTLLDIACGAGQFAQMAALHGAQISGIDASAASIEIARQRVPSGNFTIGEMEELPYPDHSFDVVTGFNAFQYASNPVHALQDARRVTKPGGKVAMVVWGKPQDCETDVTLKALGALLPPSPPGAPAPLALSQPGVVEGLLQQAGLRLIETGEVDCPYEYPDDEIAVLAIGAAGPAVRAMRAAGEDRVRGVILQSLIPYKRSAGGYLQKNKFRYFLTLA
jgi:SAM-dependent methyltransferase